MRRALCLAVLLTALAAPAAAQDLLINNGLAPPEPTNVITAPVLGGVQVHDAGCDAPGCLDPGAPTSVELVPGGLVALGFEALGASQLQMLGGSVGGDLAAHESGGLGLEGGLVGGDVYVGGDASGDVGGGAVTGALRALGASRLQLSGGSFAGLEVGDSARITIVGSDFRVDGSPVAYGSLNTEDGSTVLLSGVLMSGESFEVPYTRSGGGFALLESDRFHSVPALGAGQLPLAIAAFLVALALRSRRAAAA